MTRKLPQDRRKKATAWTVAEKAELERRRDSGAAFEAIARDLGRPLPTVKAKYFDLKRYKRETVQSQPQREAEARAEAARASLLVPTSLTALVFGDPLPGRSALDKRHGGGGP